jgi:hypothetical protein
MNFPTRRSLWIKIARSRTPVVVLAAIGGLLRTGDRTSTVDQKQKSSVRANIALDLIDV